MGLITRTSAGITPANRRMKPSSRMRVKSVARVEGAFGLGAPGSESSEDSDLRVVIRVLTTQMGLVMRTVALPASAPANIDSTVVSFIDARPALRAAFSKKERVHSYPSQRDQSAQEGMEG